MNAIVFNTFGDLKRAAVIFDDEVFRFEVSEGKEGRIGDIYMGRVSKVLDSLQAAFVDLGMDRNGYIQKSDLKGEVGMDRISSMLKPGDEVAVQIKKEAVGGKGPKLTGKISIQGESVVLYDDDRNLIAISNKVTKPGEIRRLKELACGMHRESCGMIVRTHAESLTDDSIRSDYEKTLRKWESVKTNMKYAKAPRLISDGRDFVVETVINNAYRGVDRIVFDSRDDMGAVLDGCSGIKPETCEFSDVSEGEFTFSRFGIDKALEEAIKEKVWLGSGGNIIIEETEALTSIDVNSAKSSSAKGRRGYSASTNREAAREAARQIILRNLSGMILIDFIDAGSAEREELRRIMEEMFVKYDNRKHDIYGFTRAGLFEMVREKKGISMRSLHVRDEAVANPIYTLGRVEREMARIKSETSMKSIELKTDSKTAEWLKDMDYGGVVKKRYGIDLGIKVDKSTVPGNFKINYL